MGVEAITQVYVRLCMCTCPFVRAREGQGSVGAGAWTPPPKGSVFQPYCLQSAARHRATPQNP